MKTIQIKKLAIDTTIGVYDFEKVIKQRLYISLILNYDFGAAMQSDALCDTLDYSAISRDIKVMLESNAYELIEKILGCIASLLREHYHIKHFAIEVEKPSALPDAETVSVTFDNRKNK